LLDALPRRPCRPGVAKVYAAMPRRHASMPGPPGMRTIA